MENVNVEEATDAVTALTADERRFIQRAQNDKFENGGIERYYRQAVKNKVHEAVLSAIESRMRTDFPKAARTVFGAKGEQAEEMLVYVRDAVLAKFDISGNGLGNHIKVGGDERRTGTAYIYRYISYRARGEHCGAQISLIQATPEQELRVLVRYYRVYEGSDNIDEQVWFTTSEIALARHAYSALLDKLQVPHLDPTT